MNTLLISGITGFVGKSLTNYLKNKYQIEGIYRQKGSHQLTYKTIKKTNFDNKRAFIHLAGKAHDLKNISEPKEYFEVNTNLTISLFDKFLKSNCEKFIFMSTVKAVADTIEGELTEETNPNPKTSYGKSKLEAEKYILSKKLPAGKQVYILRPCMIHGPGNKGNLNLLYKFISKGVPYPLGSYDNKRSFVSVENLCFVIKQLIERDILSGVYNIADDEPLSTKELVRSIGATIGRPVKVLSLPKKIVHLLASVGGVLSLPFDTHRLNKLVENYVVSNTKIKKALGVNLPVSTKEGLVETIKSF